jgi:hypothetical protein
VQPSRYKFFIYFLVSLKIFFSLVDIAYSKVILIIRVRCFTHTLHVCLRAHARMCVYVCVCVGEWVGGWVCVCVYVIRVSTCMHNNISTFYSSRKRITSLFFASSRTTRSLFLLRSTCPVSFPGLP